MGEAIEEASEVDVSTTTAEKKTLMQKLMTIKRDLMANKKEEKVEVAKTDKEIINDEEKTEKTEEKAEEEKEEKEEKEKVQHKFKKLFSMKKAKKEEKEEEKV